MMIVVFMCQSVSAQKDSKRLERANTLFEDYSYVQAIVEYEKLLKKNDIAEAKLKLAECYRLTKQMDNAERWYWSASEQNAVDSIYMYNYASVLKYNKKYDEAKAWYLKYEGYKQDGKGAKQAKFLELIHYFVRDSSKVDIKNMAFNSEYADFSPSFFKDGLLYSSSQTKGKNAGGLDQWTGENFLDLYYIEKVNVDSSGKSKKLPGFINSNFHEGPTSFDAKNNTIYFTRNSVEKGIQKRSKEGVLKIQIYTAATVDNRWDVIAPFSLDNPEFVFCHPAITKDGTRIYFASDMPGGFGGLDIYYSDKNESGWSSPVNLGEYVNTQWNEGFPYIHSTGTLYFASDGLPGLGGLDVYSVRFGGREWIDVKNLGYPINTSRDDFGFILDSTDKSGYVSSNREGGKGSDDIYSIYIKDTYFEEGVLLSVDEESANAPQIEPNDFDMPNENAEEQLPAEAFQPAKADSVAGLPVVSSFEADAIEEALSQKLFKPDYSQEDELAMKMLKDDKAVVEHAKETEKFITQQKKSNTAESKSMAAESPSSTFAQSSSSTPAEINNTKSATVASVKKTSSTSVKAPITVQAQISNMKDAKGRIMLEKAPYTQKAKSIEGLTYRVQVGAYSKALRKSPDQLFKMQGIETYDMNDGILRYITPNTLTDIKSAEAHKKQMVAKGVRDAFIVPFYNGKRISPEEVVDLLNQ